LLKENNMHGPYDDIKEFPELNDGKARTERIEKKKLLDIMREEKCKQYLIKKYLTDSKGE